MRIIDYLDALNWTQNRLSQEAHVSISTIQRLVQAKPISRVNVDKICATLTQAMGYTVTLHDINELNRTRAERPERRKQYKQEHEDLLISPRSDNTEDTTQQTQRSKKHWPLG
jgi:DNA-binding Xre family transcriptional regulator